MKQYTTPEQTAKLIELGFERPFRNEYLHIVEEYGYAVNKERNFTIGELFEMLPMNRIEFDICVYVDTTGGLFYDEELIDALFKACVKLKEEGVI